MNREPDEFELIRVMVILVAIGFGMLICGIMVCGCHLHLHVGGTYRCGDMPAAASQPADETEPTVNDLIRENLP